MPISGSATTNRTSAAIGAQTCRLPSISALGHRQVGYLAFGSRPVGSPANCRWGANRSAVWRSGADLSAPQHIGVGGPTGRFPRKLPLGARHVGSPDIVFEALNTPTFPVFSPPTYFNPAFILRFYLSFILLLYFIYCASFY